MSLPCTETRILLTLTKVSDAHGHYGSFSGSIEFSTVILLSINTNNSFFIYMRKFMQHICLKINGLKLLASDNLSYLDV